MHVQDIRAFGLIDTLEILIGKCEAFATEFDLSQADPERMQAIFQMKEGETLLDVLSPKQFERLDKFLQKRFGFSANQFLNTRPFTVANFLTVAMMQKEMHQSLDETLHTMAQNQERLILGLETFEDQLKIMQLLDTKTEVKQLMSLVKNYKGHRKSINKLTELYINEDIQKLHKSSKKSLGKLRKILLDDRNTKMTNQFEAITKEHSLFAAVGAGHLAGKKGILKMLKDKGFKVKPVMAKFSSQPLAINSLSSLS